MYLTDHREPSWSNRRHYKEIKLITETSPKFNIYSTNLVSFLKLVIGNFEVDRTHPSFDVF